MSENFRRDAFYERNHFYVPGDNVIVSFQIAGIVPEDILKTSIKMMRTVHPMIGTHIEFDENRNAWFVAEGTPDIPLKTIIRENDQTWIKAVLDEYWEPFLLSKGPLIRFLFVQGDEIADLVVVAQHSICDGLSLTYLMRDLMTAIGNPTKRLTPQTYLPTIKEAYDLSKIKLNPVIRKILSKINDLWDKNKIDFDEEDYFPMFKAFQRHHLNAITWHLDEMTTKNFVEKCREKKVSVNSALYCAILNVQYHLQGEKEEFRKNIMMPVNIRNIVSPPIGEGVALFAGGESFQLKLKWKDDFWKQAEKIHRELQKRLSPNSVFSIAKKVMLFEPSFMDARTMLFLGSLIPEPPTKYTQLLEIISKDRLLAKLKGDRTKSHIQLGSVLTNLGVISIPEKYGSINLENITLLPPNSPLAEKLIGVVTYKNKLQGAITFAEKTLNPEIAERFVSSLVDFVDKIAQ